MKTKKYEKKNTQMLGMELKKKKKAIKGSKENDYAKDYIKTKFNSGDHLPLNKPLKFHVMTIIIRSVFEEDSKL